MMNERTRLLQIYQSDDYQVQQARVLLRWQAPNSFTALFTGPCWCQIEWVALAFVEGQLVGMASLAPWDADAEGGPKIVGVWVAPHFRQQGIGTALVTCLIHMAHQQYGVTPYSVVIRHDGKAFAHAWAAKNIPIPLQIVPENEMVDLQD